MRNGPRVTKSHISKAAVGTVSHLDKPNSSPAAITPANSATTVAVLATNITPRANKVHETPNCSRISSPKPFWVTAPMRAAISCTKAKTKVMATSRNSIR